MPLDLLIFLLAFKLQRCLFKLPYDLWLVKAEATVEAADYS